MPRPKIRYYSNGIFKKVKKSAQYQHVSPTLDVHGSKIYCWWILTREEVFNLVAGGSLVTSNKNQVSLPPPQNASFSTRVLTVLRNGAHEKIWKLKKNRPF